MELTGTIKSIMQTTDVSFSFKKREFVIETDEQYPQTILLEFVQDKCSLLDSYRPFDKVKVSINIRGREWVDKTGQTKYFNTIQAWRIEKDSEIPS